jgi:hypothetical protein
MKITTAGMKHRAQMEWRGLHLKKNHGHTAHMVIMWWNSETYSRMIRLFDREPPGPHLTRAVNEILKDFGVARAQEKTQAKLKAAKNVNQSDGVS